MKHFILVLIFFLGVSELFATDSRTLTRFDRPGARDTFDFYFDAESQRLEILFSETAPDCNGDFIYLFQNEKLHSVFSCKIPPKLTFDTGTRIRLIFVSDAISFGGKTVFKSVITPKLPASFPPDEPALTKSKGETLMADGCTPCPPTITANAERTTICEGECTFLNASARLFRTVNDNFNGPAINNALWNFSNGTLAAGCGQVDGTPTLWFGSGVPERFAETKELNTVGACNVAFQFKYGTEVNPSDNGCEDADEPAEDVKFQYFNGTDWIILQTFSNNGLNPGGPFDDWQRVCIDIPADAQRSNTKFRWMQSAHSGFGFDQWAIDNVSIDINLIPRYRWQGPHFLGAGQDTIQRPAVCPPVTGTYTVTAFNGNTSVQTTVRVEVIDKDGLGGTVLSNGQSNIVVCPNQRPPILQLSGFQGNIVGWQQSELCNGVWTPVGNNAPTYVAPPLTVTTCYRALIQFGPCTDVSDSVRIQVPTTEIGSIVIDKANACVGELVTYTWTGGIGDLIRWEYGSSREGPFSEWPGRDNPLQVNASGFNCFRAIVKYPGCEDSTARPTAVTCMEFVRPLTQRGVALTVPWFECGDSVRSITAFGFSPAEVVKWERKPEGGAWTDIPNSQGQVVIVTPDFMKPGECFRVVTNRPDTVCEVTFKEICVRPTPCDSSCEMSGGNYCYLDTVTTVFPIQGNMRCKRVARFEVAENPNNLLCSDPSLRYVVQPDSLNEDSLGFKFIRRVMKTNLCIRGLAVENYGPPPRMAYLYTAVVNLYRVPSSLGTFTATPNRVCAGSNNGLVEVSGFSDFLNIKHWEIKPSDKDTAWQIFQTSSPNITYQNLTRSTSYRVLYRDPLHGCQYYSDTVKVEVFPGTVGGVLEGGRDVCQDNPATWLNLKNFSGVPIRWETSLNDCNGPWSFFTNSPITDFITRRLTRSTCFRVVLQSGTCPEAVSTPALVRLLPPPAGGVVSGSATVCIGLQGPRLTLDANTGTVVRWEKSLDCAGFTNPDTLVNTQTFYDVPPLDQNTCFRAIVSNGACEGKSQIALVSVVAATLPGKLSGPTRVCFDNAADLRLSESTGEIIRWESRPQRLQNWTNTINHTLNTYNTGPLRESTCYRVVVKSPSCPEAATNPFCVLVDSLPLGGTLTPDTAVCVGQPVGTLRLKNYRGGVIQWERSNGCTNNFSIIPGSNFAQFNPGQINQNTCFRVLVSVTGCGNAYSDVHEVRVIQPTQGGTLSPPQTICAGSPSNLLTLTGHLGTILIWEQNEDNAGWQPLPGTENRTSYVIPAVNKTSEFRVKVRNVTCPEAFSLPVKITVITPEPVGTLTPATSVCEGSPGTTLTLNGNTGNILRWERSDNCTGIWTSIANVTNTLATGPFNRTTCFRAVVNGITCPEGFTAPLTLEVEPLPSGGELTGSKEVCDASASVTFRLRNHTGTIRKWQSSLNNLDWTDLPAPPADTLRVVNVTQNTFYRAEVGKGICPLVWSDTAMVKVLTAPKGGKVTPERTICLGQASGTYQLSDHSGTVLRWEVSKDAGTNWTSVGKAGQLTYNPVRLTVTTWIRAVIGNAGCPDAFSEPVKATVVRAPFGGIITGGGTFCTAANMPVLTLIGHQGTLDRWEESNDDGRNWIAISHSLTTYKPANFSGKKQFRVRVSTPACGETFSVPATIEINDQTVGGEVLQNITICLGTRSPRMRLVNFVGEVMRWEVSKDSSVWTSMGKWGQSSYQAGSMSVTTWFRAAVRNTGCDEVYSRPARVTVIRQPLTPVSAGSITADRDSVCVGSPVRLTLVGNQTPVSYWEYTESDWVNAVRIDLGAPVYTFNQTANVPRRYRVAVSNPCGTAFSESIEIKPISGPSVTVSTKGTCDAGGSIEAVSSQAGSVFALNPGGIENLTGIFRGINFGNYVLTVKGTSGCETMKAVQVVPAAPDPPIITQVINVLPTMSRILWTRTAGNRISYVLRWKMRTSVSWNYEPNVPDTFKNIQPLQPTTHYDVQVAAVCLLPGGGQDTTAWSDGIIKGFLSGGRIPDCLPLTMPIPGTPTNLHYDSLWTRGVRVRWNPVRNTQGYIVSHGLLSQNPNGWIQKVVCAPDTFLVITNLSPGQPYGVRVRANCSNCTTAFKFDDRRSNWSPRIEFTTPNRRTESDDLRSDSDMRPVIYPNPAQGSFHIKMTSWENMQPVEVFVYDLTGRKVFSDRFIGTERQIELKGLSPGTYLLEIRQGTNVYREKLMTE